MPLELSPYVYRTNLAVSFNFFPNRPVVSRGEVGVLGEKPSLGDFENVKYALGSTCDSADRKLPAMLSSSP